MRKKKLLFLGYDLRIGGIENALIALLHNINYQKYDVTLILEKVNPNEIKRVPSQVRIQEYKVSNHSILFFRKISNLFRRIRFFIKNYHRYQFSCSYATYSIPGSVLARIASSNNSLYVHSNYAQLYNRTEFVNFFNHLKIDKFRTIFFVSNESKADFLKYFPFLATKTVVCNNFIDGHLILEKSLQEINIERKSQFVLTFVGRLDDTSKQLTKLFSVIEYLKSHHVSVECWIVGDGPDREKYVKIVRTMKLEKSILFFGRQNNPYPYMRKSDFIILTSKYEGFPVVYLESIILKKKIISTIDVSDEFISIPNRFGYIISQDEEKMKKEVFDILEDDSLEYENIDFSILNKQKQEILEAIFDQLC